MIQHDHQSRWKAWMRLLAVDIRPVSMSTLRMSTSPRSAYEPRVPFCRGATVGGAPRFVTGSYSARTSD